MASGFRLDARQQTNFDVEVFNMDLPVLANILGGSFTNFRGHPEELYRCLLSRRDFRSLAGCPSNDQGFLSKLKEIAPEMRALGVVITISGGLVTIQTRAAAEKEQAAESALLATFNSSAAIRAEFGNFERYSAYQRGVASGRIHEPRVGRIAAEDQGTSQIDARLPIEKQCRKRWELDVALRSEFRNNFDSFLAYEKANAAGQVRRLAPKA
jgi:hypothetical protein